MQWSLVYSAGTEEERVAKETGGEERMQGWRGGGGGEQTGIDILLYKRLFVNCRHDELRFTKNCVVLKVFMSVFDYAV